MNVCQLRCHSAYSWPSTVASIHCTDTLHESKFWKVLKVCSLWATLRVCEKLCFTLAVFQEIMWTDLQKLEHVGAKCKQSYNFNFNLKILERTKFASSYWKSNTCFFSPTPFSRRWSGWRCFPSYISRTGVNHSSGAPLRQESAVVKPKDTMATTGTRIQRGLNEKFNRKTGIHTDQVNLRSSTWLWRNLRQPSDGVPPSMNSFTW